MGDVDPSLLALSDLLVLTALERAWSRSVRRARYGTPAAQRHNQYLRSPVPVEKIDSALRDSWVLCPILADRHDLDTDPAAWQQLLDSYTRALLMAGQSHHPDRLAALLGSLPSPDGWDG